MNTNYLLELKGITKNFGNFRANDDIFLSIKKGSIHALIGENGAGKSTLINIIYGAMQADSGTITWDSIPVKINSPNKAQKLGIGVVFQKFSCIESFTVAENIILGTHYKGKKNELYDHIREVSEKYHLPINPKKKIFEISAGEKQKVEIIRCLLRKPQLLILDEPTSVLSPLEVEKLFDTLRVLKENNHSILFISHKLKEVTDLCDQVTVLRKGKIVSHFKPHELAEKEIVRLMIGKEVENYLERDTNTVKKEILQIQELVLQNEHNIQQPIVVKKLTLKTGTITGIAGISGNGQDILLKCLSGESFCLSDKILLDGNPIGDWDVDRLNKKGILFVPTERLGRATIGELNLIENSLLGAYHSQPFIKNGLIEWKLAKNYTQEVIEEYRVSVVNALVTANKLSGGNLQKFVIGRTLMQNPRVLLLSNPTWGVDVDSTTSIHNILIKLRDLGVAILVVSEDLEELLLLSDEIAIINQGNVSDTMLISETSIQQIGSMMVSNVAN